MNEVRLLRQSILDEVADNWSPSQIRDLSYSLLRLADSVDQDWRDEQKKSIFRWPNELHRIERDALNLAARAKQAYRVRRNRDQLFPDQLLGEPGWDMLLELFMQYAGGTKVSTTSLCIASSCPTTTALRYIAMLEQEGLIQRTPGTADRRVSFVELTNKGILAMGKCLEAM